MDEAEAKLTALEELIAMQESIVDYAAERDVMLPRTVMIDDVLDILKMEEST